MAGELDLSLASLDAILIGHARLRVLLAVLIDDAFLQCRIGWQVIPTVLDAIVIGPCFVFIA